MSRNPLPSPPSVSNPFAGFTDIQLDVLDDMVSEWSDKDRHGELVSGWSYDADQLRAFLAIETTLHAERKRRGMTF